MIKIQHLKLFFSILLLFILSNCGGFKKMEAGKVPVNATERAQKNMQEGKGFRLSSSRKNSGVFDFATSNEMWRASLDLLDFTPLSNVDYSGGIIITDWFSEENSKNEYLKITIRFLSNEIRSDGINILIYKKTCTNNNVCSTSKVPSKISQEIKTAILQKATILKENELDKNKDYKIKGTDSSKR
jgi:hypothetical protein